MPQNKIIEIKNKDYFLDDDIETTYSDEEIDTAIANYSTYELDIIFSLQDYDNINDDGLLSVDLLGNKNANLISLYGIEKIEREESSIASSLSNRVVETVGGIGFNTLDLDFRNSENGVTSFLKGNNSGEYISSDAIIEFSNIEAFEIIGSPYDDILLGSPSNSSFFNTTSNIDGGDGYDRLVIDYSANHNNYKIATNPYSNTLNISDSQTNEQNVINFNSIESFNITTGNGDNFILLDIGYLDGASSDDIIDAGDGNDWIYTDRGHDIVDGGNGFDVLSLSFADRTSGVTSSLNSDGSGEYITDSSSIEFGNIEAVYLLGSSYDDVLVAFAYDNSAYDLTFSSIVPVIDGGNGFDELVVNYSHGINESANLGVYFYNDSLLTHDPQTGKIDTLDFQNIEAFNLTTGDGNNIIDLGYDNPSNDRIYAGDGNDEIATGKGFDIVDGGNGTDSLTLNFNSSSAGITSALSSSSSGIYSNRDRTLKIDFNSIEAINVVGSSNDDILYGLQGRDTIYGGSGADTIRSGSEDDFINGADGDDLLIGGNGNDTIYGGSGIDRIIGNNGNDLISGNEERDFLFGQAGNDSLKGGLGNDVLKGGQDNDVLFGGEGKDVLFGDRGMDIFALEADATQFDIIKDFTNGVDSFGLTNGLAFEDLRVSSRSSQTGIIIRHAGNNDVIAVVIGIEPLDITSEDFVVI